MLNKRKKKSGLQRDVRPFFELNYLLRRCDGVQG
jgi:hypothetical protein